MKCKKCKKEIPDGSFYCNICGAKQFKDDEVQVPAPRRKKDGSYSGQVYRHGTRITIEGKTLAEYRQNARDFKLSDGKLPEDELAKNPLIFGELLDNYIAAREGKVSPATISNLTNYSKNRFKDAMDLDIRLINWQKLIDHEATFISPLSLRSVWSVIKPMFAFYGLETPEVELPKVVPKEQDFLDSTQIPVLLNGIVGNEYEPAILLALHSLRLSELCAIMAEDIYDGFIHVNKAVVTDKTGNEVTLNKNKTEKSTRNIPVMIDRLYDVLPKSGLIVTQSRVRVTVAIKKICTGLGLPPCSAHDLRRSFCSLCYEKGVREEYLMAYGGWSSYATVHKYYIKLSEKSKVENAEILRDYFNITSNS